MQPRSVIGSLLADGGEEPWEKSLPARRDSRFKQKRGRKFNGDIFGIVVFTLICASIALAVDIFIPLLYDNIKKALYEMMRDYVFVHEEL
eukprot:SAG31_NODE_442_length_15661_cov_4.132245_9_plen_90_part_00